MKRTALIIAAAMLSTMAMARTYQFSAQNATRSPIAIAWYQGEDIAQTISDASISNSDAVVWDVVSATNYSLTYIITTGTVSAVTNATFSVSPSNSNLTAGDYIGFVRTIKIDQQNAVTAQTIIARQTIRVLPASDTRTTSYRGPLTQCLIETDPLSVHTNQIGSGLGIIGGLLTATGTPVGSESDPIWTSASNQFYTKTSANALFATGTPLYAYTEADPAFVNWLGTNAYIKTESDPVWAGASNQFYTKTSANALFATGTPLYAYTETDPSFVTWLSTNTYPKADSAGGGFTNISITGGTAETNGASLVLTPPAAADGTNSVLRDGAIITGRIDIRQTGIVCRLSTTNTAMAFGRNATAWAIGDTAFGFGAKSGQESYDNGTAFGYNADGRHYGVAVGQGASGYSATLGFGYGVGVGYNASGGRSGTAVGSGALATYLGCAFGRDAIGVNSGVALGSSANGSQTNIAVGYAATCGGGKFRIAIGVSANNTVDNSALVRGNLYLDGAQSIYMRTNFGVGVYGNALVVSNGEWYAVDASGNWTLFSPHRGSAAPVDLLTYWPDLAPDEKIDLSWNDYTGCGWARRVELIEAAMSSGNPYPTGAFIRFTFTPRRDWDAEENRKQQCRENEIAAFNTAKKKWNDYCDLPEKESEPHVKVEGEPPQEYIAEKCPEWIASKLRKIDGKSSH